MGLKIEELRHTHEYCEQQKRETKEQNPIAKAEAAEEHKIHGPLNARLSETQSATARELPTSI